MIFKRTNILFLLIILIAVIVRIIIIENLFLSSDDADIPNNVIKNYSWNKIDNLFIHGHGIITFVFPLMTYSLTNLLSININEFIWNLHSIIFGIISLIYLYLLVKLFANKKIALLSVFLFSLFPAHVYFSSKLMMLFLILDFLFLYMSIYYMILFIKSTNNKYAFLAGLSVGLYILTSVVFPLIFLIIGIMLFNNNCFKKIICLKFLTPIILASSTLGIINLIHYIKYQKLTGVIGHVLNSSSGGMGLFFIPYIKSMFILSHPITTIILFLTLLISIKSFKQLNKNIMLYFGVIYSIPYVFFFTRFIEGVAPYLLNAFSFFLIWFIIKLFSSKSKQSIRILTYLIILVVFLIGWLSLVFPTINFGWFNTGIYGLYNVNKLNNSEVIGVKEAADWVKNNTNNNATIFSDTIGGAGIEPPVAEYYFQRKSYALFDGQEYKVKQLFEKVKNEVNILVLKHDFIIVDGTKFKKYFELKDENNETIITIYQKI